MNQGYIVLQRQFLSGCAFAVSTLALSLVACGGGGSDGAVDSGTVGAGGNGGYTISGTVTGLPAGSTLTVSNNGSDSVTVQANGAFSFPVKLAAGSSYAVTVNASINYLSCVVGHGTGTANSDVSGVAVSCLPWQVTTLAGDGTAGYKDLPGASAEFRFPEGVALDGQGNVFVSDTYNQVIRKISPAGVVSTLAAVAGAQGSQDGACGQASFSYPKGLAVNSAGNVVLADDSNNSVREILPNANLPGNTTGCLVKTVAGAGVAGFLDGKGQSAQFNSPTNVVVDSALNMYVADYGNNRVRKIAPDGTVTTLAGNGVAGNTNGSGGANGLAEFSGPAGVAIDVAGNVYVADQENSVIRMVTPDGAVSTLAGSGHAGYSDGAATNAQFSFPSSVAVDAKGNVYVADTYNYAIRMITPSGSVSTVAGGTSGHADGDSTQAKFSHLTSIAVDGAGSLYITEDAQYIRKISPPVAP